MNDIEKIFMNYVIAGFYLDAKFISFDRMSGEEFYDLVIELGFETSSISLYTFIWFLIQKQESAYLHEVASILISQALSHLQGAYSSGLFHARRSVELEPNNVSYKEYLLFFYGIPDKIMSDEEAFSIAQEILRNDPTNQTALKALEDIKWFQAKSENDQN